MQRTNSTAPRRGRGALARRLALGLSLALVAGAVALPAFAEADGPRDPEIISPQEDTTIRSGVLQLAASATPNTPINFAVRQTLGNDTSCNTASRFTVLGRDVSGNLSTDSYGNWHSELDVREAEDGLYCFAFDPADGPRIIVKFTLAYNAALEGFDDDDITECFTDGADECTVPLKIEGANPQDFSANVDAAAKGGEQALIGFRAANGDGLDAIAGKACDDALLANGNRNQRFGPNLVQLVPVGFAEGTITVTSTIPADFVNQQSAKGAGLFQVCVVPDVAEYGSYNLDAIQEDGDTDVTGLFGPILLESCPEEADLTPCIESKTKDDDGNVILTYRIPTQDPFMK